MKEPRADAVMKNLPAGVQEEIFGLFTKEDGTKRTLQDVHGLLPEYGLLCSLSSFAEWRRWYALERRMESAKARAEQVRLRLLAEDPDMDPAKLEAVAQMVFTAETLEQGDVKNYVALATLRLKEKLVGMDDRRIKLLEAKAAQADKATATEADAKLSEEEKAARIRQIFRMG